MTRPTDPSTETSWQLCGLAARLCNGAWQGSIDLSAPQHGLGEISLSGKKLAGTLLGLQIDANATTHPVSTIEAYQRGSDLVAAYGQTDDRPFRTTVYWRAQSLAAHGPVAAVDLIVSIQTNLLDSTPRLCSRTRIAAADMRGIGLPAESEAAPPAVAISNAADAVDFGCVILPLEGIDATYCEMIHPSDWRGVQIQRTGGAVELSWALVGHFMEKGVVRRLRVRGALFDGRPDESLIRDHYAAFAASAPPLTT